ncbi:MAG: hypothetical protein COB66_00720 [Coxiella sp. (in: Bacteria)]|nr:MAG: hypothetical protein COB66_00720 [Coxiella sp. (in: g-proteobacteria)]
MLINHETLVLWVDAIGYTGVSTIIFVETGLFFGFFLPGDSLLFLAGLLASRDLFNIWTLLSCLVAASFLGYLFAYCFGHKLGNWLLHRPDTFWYKKRYMNKAHDFYKRLGNKAILLGRFVPVVRTFCGIVAGMVKMPFKRFILYNLLGSLLWVCLITVLGYFVADAFPQLLDYMVVAVLSLIVITIIVPIIQERRKKNS